ncbi:MAG: hypothetical protein PUC50_14800 [Bacteroidales bacterium]|jgi:hypothetical protein|nr:hypothetical protein [Bacteroidales bacterium]
MTKQDNTEYYKFWMEFITKGNEIRHKFYTLSPENQQRFLDEPALQAMAINGIVGFFDYLKRKKY